MRVVERVIDVPLTFVDVDVQSLQSCRIEDSLASVLLRIACCFWRARSFVADRHQMSDDADDSGSLSVLLQNNDDLLQKILSFLVGNGLCGSRRVCRRWYDVCRRLPMRLQQAPSTAALTLANTFPSADSASFFDIGGSPTEPGPSLATGLAQMRHLRHLELRSYKERRLPDELPAVLLSMKTLRSLSITLTESPVVAIEFMDVVRSLTLLTALSFSAHSFLFVLPVDPITELQRLRELTGNLEVLWIANRAPRFPLLPHLTSLTCHRPYARQVAHPHTLQVIHSSPQTEPLAVLVCRDVVIMPLLWCL